MTTIKEKLIAHLIVEPCRPDVPLVSKSGAKAIPPITEVFDFRKNWLLLQPFLDEADIASALVQQMEEYIKDCQVESGNNGRDAKRWEKNYDPASGPWYYTSSNYWKERTYGLADDAVERGAFNLEEDEDGYYYAYDMEMFEVFISQFNPRPNTVEWYQLQTGSFWLAPWLRRLGRAAFPLLDWKVAKGNCHAFAYGTDGQGNIVLIFDILNFENMTAHELVDFVLKEYSEAEDEVSKGKVATSR